MTPIIMATADTPDKVVVRLKGVEHVAIAEVHQPRNRGDIGTCRRRPIVGRMDANKRMARRKVRIAARIIRIHQARQLDNRRQPLSLLAPHHPPDTLTEAVTAAAEAMNHRPRKCLGFQTPWEVFTQLTQSNIQFQTRGALMG